MSDPCESIFDCELPVETYEPVAEGERVICPKCGREWVYEDGAFTQTGGRVEVTDS